MTPGVTGRKLHCDTALQYILLEKGESNMVAKTKGSSKVSSPLSQLAGWARQGIESFAAAQKILFDLTARQNAVVMGMVRERMSQPRLGPTDTITKFADKGVENFTAAGKILLDLAAGETALVADWAKEGPRFPAAGAVTDEVRHRVEAFIALQKRLLDVASEQTRAVAESYLEGKGWKLGGGAAELARRGIEGFVEIEKMFLEVAAHEVAAASGGGKDGRRAARNQLKIFTHLAREGVEKYIDVQKRLLDLAIDQLEFTGEASRRRIKAMRQEVRTSWRELTAKSIWNFLVAQKSLIDLAGNPLNTSAAEETRKTSHTPAKGQETAGRKARICLTARSRSWSGSDHATSNMYSAAP